MELNRIPGVSCFPKSLPLINLQVGSSNSGRAQYQYTLQGFNTEKLYLGAQKLYEAMESNPAFSGVSTDLQLNQPQIVINVMRDQARSYEITTEDIQNTLKLAYGETYITRINTAQNQYYVVMQVENEFYQNPTDLAFLYVKSSSTGEMVPLNSVVNFEQKGGAVNVNHLNGLPSVTLSFNVPEGKALGNSIDELNQLAEQILSSDVVGNVQGSANIFLESFQSLKFLFVIALVVIYLILGILYENFIHPITILSTLPPTILGGLLSLYVFRMFLDLYSFVGLIMLMGIVLKNSIMMIDFANDIRKENPEISPEEAIHEGASLRFRPILMTTLSTITGISPIALGFGGAMAKGRIPLGVTIIGGLLLSQVMTLFITPCFYIYLEKFTLWMQNKFTIFKPTDLHEEGKPPS